MPISISLGKDSDSRNVVSVDSIFSMRRPSTNLERLSRNIKNST